ncbi:MAG TPA: type II toxin-antitoxin system HicB family antitoxin [Methylocystis sp.]|jgi:predicted RNase H-like HicB family nuclease
MKRYFAILDGGPGAFGVSFPDCPGCVAMGKDENEAYENAIEALSEWVRDAMEEGEAPQPRSIEALRRDDDVNATIAEGGIFLRVPLIIESGKPVKANISLDQGLLAEIDAAARRSGLTRSAFLASAAREKIAASA